MDKSITRISTRDMPRDKWLALRRQSIGGSDAAAIVGLSDYSSPYSVWADKTGRIPDKPDNEAMRQGRDLEDYVARRWTEITRKNVRRVNAMLYNPEYPHAHADVDRWVVAENAGLECKTTSVLNLKRFSVGDFPARYYAQCVHYMAVTGADRWYLAVLVLGQGFYRFCIERDPAEIDALMAQEATFWRHVKSDSPPPVDAAPATGDTLRTIYADSSPNDNVALFGREAAIASYFALADQISAAEEQQAEIKHLLMVDLGAAETGYCGDYKVTWRPQSRKSFDAQKYFAAHQAAPDPSAYYTVTKSRVMRITKTAGKTKK